MSLHQGLADADGAEAPIDRWADADPATRPLPVRLSRGQQFGVPTGLAGGADDVVRRDQGIEGHVGGGEPAPDAVARGWVSASGAPRGEALFVLAGRTLGISRGEPTGAPLWLDLDQLVNLDALGDPVAGPAGEPVQEVEIVMEDGSVIGAGWPLSFCDDVVSTLKRLSNKSPVASSAGPDVQFEEVTGPGAVTGPVAASSFATSPRPSSAPVTPEPAPPARAAHEPMSEHQPAAERQPIADQRVTQHQPIGERPPAAERVARASRPGTLELEDVVYLGGYPGHTKKRKRCTATLSRSGLEVSGPGDLNFRIAWDGVRTIEIQNSDEARFRMNAKIHRDASALVVECDQGVSILLEARDCPTIALRSAISQLMADLPVVVV